MPHRETERASPPEAGEKGCGTCGDDRIALSIIIVNWNSIEYVRECIDSIHCYTKGIPFEIIVVDNASRESGLARFKRDYPGVILLENETNLGFAGANNVGLRRARGENILFLNPDVKLISPATTILLDALGSLPDVGIIGCKHLAADSSMQHNAVRSFPTIVRQVFECERISTAWPFRMFSEVAPLYANTIKPVRVDVISGACMMMKRSICEKVSGFDEGYFMYGEDIDLNLKVSKLGLHNYYVGTAQIIHYGGRSSKKQSVNSWALIMQLKARRRYYRKWRGVLYSELFRAAIGVSALFRVFLLYLLFPTMLLNANGRWRTSALEKWKAVGRWSLAPENALGAGRGTGGTGSNSEPVA